MAQTINVEGVGQVSFPDDATQEEIQKALNERFPAPPPQTSATGAAARAFAQGAIPTATGIAATSPLLKAAMLAPGWSKAITVPAALGVGALVSGLTAKAQKAGLQAIAPETEQRLEQLQAADVQQHPIAAAGGRLAAVLPSAAWNPGQGIRGLAAIPAAIRGDAAAQQAAKVLGLNVGMQEALTAGQTLISEKRLPTVGEATEAAAAGVLFGEPRGYLRSKALEGRLEAIAKARRVLPAAAQEAKANLAYEALQGREGVKTPAESEKRPTEAQGASGEALAGLSEEEAKYLQAEREGMAVPLETATAAEGDPNAPFARSAKPGEFMTIRRPGTNGASDPGAVLVYPQEFSLWLKSLNPARRSAAVKARLAEEQLHLQTTPEDAASYWGNLTSLEKALEGKLYTGEFRGQRRFGFTDTQMGFEAIRRRMQQLARLDSSEVAELAGRERWSAKGLELLNSTLRKLREGLGTKASKEQLAILDRMQANAKVALATTTGREPAAFRKGQQEGDEFLETERPTDDQIRAMIEGYEADAAAEKQKGNLAAAERLYGEAEKGKRLFPQWQERSFPAAFNKERLVGLGETPEFALEPVRRGQPVEREAFAKATPQLITAAAQQHAWSAKMPEYDTFKGEMQQRYGANVREAEIKAAFKDAMLARLMTAKGGDLQHFVKAAGIDDPMAKGNLADAPPEQVVTENLNVEQMRAWLKHQAKQAKKSARSARGREEAAATSEPLQKRFAAIGALIEHYERQLGPEPAPNVARTEIGPEDVSQKFVRGERTGPIEGIEGTQKAVSVGIKPSWRQLDAQEASDPNLVGSIATADSRAHGQRVTVSKNLITLQKPGGPVVLVSAWNDGRRGPVVTDPTSGKGSRPIDSALLREWTPGVVMQVREPLQGFRQVFDSAQAFDRHFGDIGLETEATPTETEPPIPATKPTEPATGARELETPGRTRPIPTAATLFARGGHLAGQQWPVGRVLPEPVQGRVSAPAESPYTPTSAMQLPPGVQSQLAQRGLDISPFARGQRPSEVQPWTEKGRSLKEIAAMRAQAAAQAEAAKALPAPGQMELPAEPAAFSKKALKEQSEAVLAYGAKNAQAVAALAGRKDINRQMAATKDGSENFANDIGRIAENDVRSHTATGTKNIQGLGAKLQARLSGTVKTEGDKRILAAANPFIESGAVVADYNMSPEARARVLYLETHDARRLTAHALTQQGNLKQAARIMERVRRDATSVAISEGLIDIQRDLRRYRFDEDAIDELSDFEGRLHNAEQKRQAWWAAAKHENGDPWTRTDRMVARGIYNKWGRSIEALRKEVQDARVLWKDPQLRATALEMRKQLDARYSRERGYGFSSHYDDALVPGRYDAEFWSGKGVIFGGLRVLGNQWRSQRTFDTQYHAIEAGPYIPLTRDGAAIIGHRARQGERAIQRRLWEENWKHRSDPGTGKPIMADLVETPRGMQPPSLDYVELPRTSRQGRIAVLEAYRPLVEALNGHSAVSEMEPLRIALEAAQRLKHTLLLGDFFHLGRLTHYAYAIMGRKAGYLGGLSAMELSEPALQRAVQSGLVTPETAQWANEKIPVRFGPGAAPRLTSRRDLAQMFLHRGLNATRILDALYKDLVGSTPLAGELLDKTAGRYNRWLFDRYTRGLMMQSALTEFERIHNANPNVDARALMRDISLDMNRFYGSIGRQGWFKSQTWLDATRMIFLAPQWVEGLVMKEAGLYKRMAGAAAGLAGLPTGRGELPAMGSLGRGMARGLLTMAVLAQAANLLFRRKPTWENDEKGHKFDAWIPGGDKGFFFNPMSSFNELGHDVERYYLGNKTLLEAADQIGMNKLSPFGRMALSLWTSKGPFGEQQTTTAGALKTAAASLVPVPISFGKLGQAAGHAVLPSVVPPTQPGAVQRQLLASLGVKTEPAASVVSDVGRMAKDWLNREGLQPQTGWRQQATDEPGYSKLRAALRIGDDRAALYNLSALRQTRNDGQIIKAMRTWAKHPFTGSMEKERRFVNSLTDRELAMYRQAVLERQSELEKWETWYLQQAQRTAAR